jgi:beta-N-acetylhexosaminidase
MRTRVTLIVSLALATLTSALPAQQRPLTRAERAWVERTLASMSLRDRAAQMVWPSVWADYVSTTDSGWTTLRRWIERDRVGGFTVSIGGPTEMATKLNAMQRMAGVPLLVGADLEAGAGFRARSGWFLPNGLDLGGATVTPPQMAIGASGDTALAYEMGRVTALEGRALGIHIVYGPVMDVNNNPRNPVINVRSFGEDPRLAGRLGASYVRGVQANGMLATAKHFPGHGDTDVNSHLALPVVSASRARLDSVELPPFQAAIDAGAAAVMSFHGSMPALDSSGVPGTLSARVMTGLLREQMRFSGLIISDAMDMKGVLVQFGLAEASIKAVVAGCDVLIQPEDVRATIDAIVAGVSTGRYTAERVTASARRVLESKARLGLHRGTQVDVAKMRSAVGDSTMRRAARQMAVRGLTLVRDAATRIPMAEAAGRRVLHVVVARRTDLGAGQTFGAMLQRNGAGQVRSVTLIPDDPLANPDRVLSLADSADVVILASYVAQSWDAPSAAAPSGLGGMVDGLIRRGKEPILLSFGNPYVGAQLPTVGTYLVAWSGNATTQTAAARALLGKEPITGRLPISMPPVAEIGAGLVRRTTTTPSAVPR